MLSQIWGAHFPVRVEQIALEYTKRFPDPILKVAKADLPNFEGALCPLKKKGGWAILYNPTIRSDGRINYTLGHELGHYFAHRAVVPTGFECGQRDVLGIAAHAERRLREREADEFASYLLMPLDDFRKQVAGVPMSIDLLKHLASRYDVSFTAAALKWLESTELCAAVVVATNGFINWCSRSDTAMKAGIFYRAGTELPVASIAALGDHAQRNEGTTLAAGAWSDRPVREIAIFADHYEMTISLLIFDHDRMRGDGWNDEPVEDAVDRFEASVTKRRSWD
jgi:hypothetical protein